MNVAGLVLEADAECHSRSPIDRPTPLFQRDVGVRVLRLSIPTTLSDVNNSACSVCGLALACTRACGVDVGALATAIGAP